MLSQLTYTNREGFPEYRLTREGEEVFVARLSLSYNGLRASVSKKGSPYCVMDFTRIAGLKPQHSLNNQKYIMPTSIYNGIGQPVGSIEYTKAKGYSYFKCSVSEYLFNAYVVVLEKEVLKLSIRSGDVQVALIEDNCEQPEGGYAYNITSVDELTAEMAALFGIFFDLHIYIPIGEFEYARRDRRFEITENAELTAMYDVDFTLSLDNSLFIGELEEHRRTAQLHTTELDLSDLDITLKRTHRTKKEPAVKHEPAPQAEDAPQEANHD